MENTIKAYLDDISLLIKDNFRIDFRYNGNITISNISILGDKGLELIEIINKVVHNNDFKGVLEQWFLQKSLPRTFISENTDSYKNFYMTGIIDDVQINTSIIVLVNLKDKWILTNSGSIYRLGTSCIYRDDPYINSFI